MIEIGLQKRIESLLKKYRNFTPIEIADDLGIKIAYIDVDDNDFSGAILKIEDGTIALFVNKNDSKNRQLFTIAHELGHFFMHTDDVLRKGIVSYRDASVYTKYNEAERKREEEANHFAAEILMPKKIFIEFYNEYSFMNITDLVSKMAKFFNVSEKAIKIRMSYLDLN